MAKAPAVKLKQVKVKATKLLIDTRYDCIPRLVLTKEKFRTLKGGESVLVTEDILRDLPHYFTKESNDGS